MAEIVVNETDLKKRGDELKFFPLQKISANITNNIDLDTVDLEEVNKVIEFDELDNHLRLSYPKLIAYLSSTFLGSVPLNCGIIRPILSIDKVFYTLYKTHVDGILTVIFNYKGRDGKLEYELWEFSKDIDEDFMIATISEYLYAFSFKHEMLHEYFIVLPGIPKSTSEPEISSTDKKEGCYIATACYGSYETPELLVFRHYRDTKLKKTFSGRLFIQIYYSISPLLVKAIGRNKLLNVQIRRYLDKIYVHLTKQ